jgi:hypothetical protein
MKLQVQGPSLTRTLYTNIVDKQTALIAGAVVQGVETVPVG